MGNLIKKKKKFYSIFGFCEIQKNFFYLNMDLLIFRSLIFYYSNFFNISLLLFLPITINLMSIFIYERDRASNWKAHSQRVNAFLKYTVIYTFVIYFYFFLNSFNFSFIFTNLFSLKQTITYAYIQPANSEIN